MAYEKKEGAKPSKKDDEEILRDAREHLRECIDEEESQRAKMKDDLRFCTLDQWPEEIRKEREGDIDNGPRPCLTIDKINQYIVQVVNDVRQGKPGINVRPQDEFADPGTAKILKGLVRNIEDQSNADIAYATAVENAARIGLGFIRITTEYVSRDSFDQEIFIRPIPNTFSTYLGKHIMPDGSDAKYGFIVEQMPLERFEQEFPDAKSKPEAFEELQDDMSYWHTGETVTVVEYFCIKRVPQTLYFLADGTTMTKEDYNRWPQEAGPRPEKQDERLTFAEKLKWYKLTGVEVLERRELPGKYIPIVEVVGREAWVDGKRVLWGLVRPAKDSLRMYNYWASTITEKIGLAPKTPFIGARGQFEGLEERWKHANRKNYPYLEYKPISDDSGNQLPAPQRQGPTPMEAAYFQFMQVIENDVKSSLGMYKAAVGDTDSQQSGRAILALQRESDTGTYHFGANLGVSVRHVGRIIVDLIPRYYDTKRVVRILGEDGEVQSVQIDPEQESARREIPKGGGIESIYNPGIGKYDVSITTGPSYNTKRMEAQATFVEMAKGAADPMSAATLRYLVMRNSDNAGADEAAKALKALLPPPVLMALDNNEAMPPRAQAQMQQIGQQMQMLQEGAKKLQAENMQLKADAQVEMQKSAAQQQQARAELALQKQKQDSELQLQREKASAEIELKRAAAMAEIGLERMKITMSADADVDAAIAKVKSLVLIHEARMNGALKNQEVAAEGGAQGQSNEQSMAMMREMHGQFLGAVQEIIQTLQAKKQINLQKRDGQIVGAEVTAA